MNQPIPSPRWYRLEPDRLILILLAFEGFIFAVSPQDYKRIKGMSPGGGDAYVLEVDTKPTGNVY